MADRLSIYNGALLALGSRKLASLTENREPRRVLDDIWNREGVRTCLTDGQWNFAIRTAQIDYSPSIEPDFGFQRVFDKPTDWVRTTAVCADEFFQEPLLQYKDEASYLYADLDTLYASWVSDDMQYGGDLSKWPANFTRYVEHWFAYQGCERLTQGKTKKKDLEVTLKKLLAKASSTDAMDDPTKMLPSGNWPRARHSGTTGRRDGGRRGRLIG